MKENLKKRYIVFEDLRMDYTVAEVKEISELWHSGYSTESIARKFHYTVVEIELLVIDLLQKEKINKRIGGMNGTVDNTEILEEEK